MANRWHVGDDRRDIGLVKAALFIGSCMADLKDAKPQTLFPNKPPEQEQTAEEIAQALEQWQLPSPP